MAEAAVDVCTSLFLICNENEKYRKVLNAIYRYASVLLLNEKKYKKRRSNNRHHHIGNK
jgi:hypothetical protein